MQDQQQPRRLWEDLTELAERTSVTTDRGLIQVAAAMLQDYFEALEQARSEAKMAAQVDAEWRQAAETLSRIIAEAARQAIAAMPVFPKFSAPVPPLAGALRPPRRSRAKDAED